MDRLRAAQAWWQRGCSLLERRSSLCLLGAAVAVLLLAFGLVVAEAERQAQLFRLEQAARLRARHVCAAPGQEAPRRACLQALGR